jgi:hypothetical protein
VSERPKRTSRALEVLKAQNATPPETEITDEELGLIAGMIQRLGDLPIVKKNP